MRTFCSEFGKQQRGCRFGWSGGIFRRLEQPPKVWRATGVEGVAANGGYDAGGWGDYANAIAGKIGAVLFAGCVAGVEGEGKDQ